MPSRKTICPNCHREQFTRSPKCRCTFCMARWTIEWDMTPEEFWSFNASAKARKTIANKAALLGVDAKALHVLFNTQWNMDGREAHWIGYSEPPPEDLRYAQAAGVMQEPMELDHRSLISQIIQARDRIDQRAVVAAFACSLITRRLDTRSTLGSYARVLHLTPHRFRAEKDHDPCHECGMVEMERISVNHFAFRRIMWAGNVYQGKLPYALCDLMAFHEQSTEIGPAEKDLLRQMIAALRKLPEMAQLTDLEKSLAGLFPGNKQERQVTLEILGLCGILKPRDCPSLHGEWIADGDMPTPTHFYHKEWRSPVNCWTGRDGVNEEAVAFWFGNV